MNDVQVILKTATPGSDRRAAQRDRLIACAEAAIADEGLAALRARSLAECTGCAVGGIYNLVTDLDELILLVGQRTMADLNAQLDTVHIETPAGGKPSAEALLVGWALAYRAFAAEHRNRWRALFEFRLPPGRDLPDWFEADQMRLFVRLEQTLAAWMPKLDGPTRQLRARTLFSAVHGIVALGLEEKLVAMPPAALEAELTAFVHAYLAGLRPAPAKGRA